MRKQKPGHCITFVYTSGTTGQPKAVMVNHDSYLTAAILLGNKVVEPKFFDGNGRVLSYLTLSHIAGQLISQIMSCIYGLETYIARPSVMKGDLIKYLRIARP